MHIMCLGHEYFYFDFMNQHVLTVSWYFSILSIMKFSLDFWETKCYEIFILLYYTSIYIKRGREK